MRTTLPDHPGPGHPLDGGVPARPVPPCGHWIGVESRVCASANSLRRYLIGHRCPDHTPSRIAGRSDPAELVGSPWWIKDDGSVIPPSPISTSSLHDRRAVSSGRRVSGARRRAAHEGEAYDVAVRGDAA